MAVKEFYIGNNMMKALERRGGLDDYIKTQLLLKAMDPQKPYSIADDSEHHRTIVSQEVEDAESD